jgi:hypothetical protein
MRRHFVNMFWIGFISAVLAGCAVMGLQDLEISEQKPSGLLDGSGNVVVEQTPASLQIRYTTRQAPALTMAPRKPTIAPVNEFTHLPTLMRSSTPTPILTQQAQIHQLPCSPLEFVDLSDLSMVVSDPYTPPPMGKDDRHQGVDFSYYHWHGDRPIDGTRIQSVFEGVVAASIKKSFPFGNLVIVETPREKLSQEMIDVFKIGEEESLFVLYAHMNDVSPTVTFGQEVKYCETLGYVGKTGNTDASHLHLETRVGPMNWRFEVFSAFKDTATMEEKQNYRLWRTSGLFLHFDPMRLFTWETSRGATATPTPSRKQSN